MVLPRLPSVSWFRVGPVGPSSVVVHKNLTLGLTD